MDNWRLATGIVASLLLTALSLAFAESDLGALLCVGIALFTGLSLFVCGFAKKGTQRLITLSVLAVYLFVPILVLTHYSILRDDVRWFLWSGGYKAKVLAQPATANEELKHAEWDGWGFAGMDTTVFLVFDPTDSLAAALGTKPPIKARGLPCGVVRIHRLDRQWYAVLFYTDTYWGQGSCT
jgi:cell division protein FtsW (lipid II flippase)